MSTTRDWEQPVRRLERLMRLKSFPVAFKMLEDKKALSDIPFVRRVKNKSTLCQMINLVRNFDWTVGADLDDFMSVVCSSIIGLSDTPEYMKDGTFRSIVWTKSRADAKKYEAAIPRLPVGKYEAVAMAPLVYNPFDPDIILIYANPAQMILLINALQFEDYEVMQFFCVGESSCSDVIARCYRDGKPSMSIPCYGERRYGHAQDDEMVMAIPAAMFDKALGGLEALYRRGIRYPISYAGAETDVNPAFPAAYGMEDFIKMLRGDDQRLLLGVTGSIATGKSTVATILEELGARTIDFDVLSRVVVEPGKPAWEDIVAYFGKQVLKEDQTLDREKLREIVFRDLEEKKKLEGFLHPRISEEFIKQVDEHSRKDPNAIIQAVVPLLIETNMQSFFHNILMVYATEDEQKKAPDGPRRLLRRNGHEHDPVPDFAVEEKKGYCDLIIDNSGPEKETRKQLEKLWKKLQKLRQKRIRE